MAHVSDAQSMCQVEAVMRQGVLLLHEFPVGRNRL